jgi:hypothetical protein
VSGGVKMADAEELLQEVEEVKEESLPPWATASPNFRLSVIKYQSHRNTLPGAISNGCSCKKLLQMKDLREAIIFILGCFLRGKEFLLRRCPKDQEK